MRRLAVLGLALALAAPAQAAAPQQGLLAPGATFGGLRLGATVTHVLASWGETYGVCRNCTRMTWYFNYRPFEPQGVALELRRGRVTALFTLWQPPGWRTTENLSLGAPEQRVTATYGPLPRLGCAGYAALVLRRGSSRTVFYVRDGRLWGFALLAGRVPACRE